MIEINLIPDVKQELINAQRVRTTVISIAIISSIVAAAVVAILLVYIFGVQTVRSALADDSIKTEATKLASVEDLSKVLTIQNQLTKISALNDEKKVNSRVFDVLSAIIPREPNQVQISTLAIDAATGTITIEGQAPNGYAALEVFKKTTAAALIQYRDKDGQAQEVPLATGVGTSDISYGEDSSGNKVLRFTLSFVYAEELFSPLSNSVSITVPNQGNVTDSYLGVPRSIFADRATDLGGGQ